MRQRMGERIRFYRGLRNMTQEGLARELGVSKQYLGHMERGQANPSFHLLERVIEVLDVLPVNLFLEEQAEGLEQQLQSGGVWTVDVQADREHWSEGLCRMLGHYALGPEASLRSFLKHLPAADQGKKVFVRFYQMTREGHTPRPLTLELVRKRGMRLTVQVRADVISGEHDEPLLAVFSFIDVTDWRGMRRQLLQSQEQLEQAVAEKTSELTTTRDRLARELDLREIAERQARDKEKQLALLIQAVPAMLYTRSVQGEEEDWYSPQLERITGYTPNEMGKPGMHWRDLIHPDDQAGVAAAGREALAPARPLKMEYRIRTRAGQWRWVHDTAAPSQIGNDHVFQGVVLDITDRKRAEEALRQSEEKFRTLMEQSSDMLYVHDLQGNLLDVNQRVREVMGYCRDELARMTVFDLHEDPLDRSSILAGWLDWAPGWPHVFEVNHRRRDGSLIPVEVVAGKVRYNNEERILGHVRDLTERRRLEAELQRRQEQLLEHSEARFHKLLENVSSVAVQGYTQEGNVVYWNRAAELFYGYTAREAMGRNLVDLIIPDDLREPVLASIQSMARTGAAPPAGEVTLRRKDGTPIHLLSSHAVVHKSDGSMELFCIDVDLEDRKQAEEALRISEARYRALFERSAEGVFLHDRDGRILEVNQAALDMFGYTFDEIRALHPVELVHPEDVPTVKALFEDILRHQTTHGQHRCRRKDGSEFIGLIRGRMIGDVIQGVLRDITLERRQEAALLRAKEAAEAADRAKSQFLDNLSHELRTPLNGVIGVMHLLQELPLDDEASQLLDAAHKSASRLTHLLTELLDLTKLEAGRLAIAAQPFSIQAVCASVSELFQVTAREKGLDLTCAVDASVDPFLLGDAARVRQILFNLVGNAVKFTQAGGVHMEVSVLPWRATDGQRILFAVMDAGIGIESERLAEIFQPFAQADGSRQRHYEGAGLGLAVVKRLVDLMGGVMSVDSEPGKGSTFYLAMTFAHVNTGGQGAEN